jgi:chromosome segregation ATPase
MTALRANLADLFQHPGAPALGAIIVLLGVAFYLGRNSAPSANQELIQALTRANAEIATVRAEADAAKRQADDLRREVNANGERIASVTQRAQALDEALSSAAGNTETLRRNYATAKTRPRPVPSGGGNLAAELDRLCAELASIGQPCRP